MTTSYVYYPIAINNIKKGNIKHYKLIIESLYIMNTQLAHQFL